MICSSTAGKYQARPKEFASDKHASLLAGIEVANKGSFIVLKSDGSNHLQQIAYQYKISRVTQHSLTPINFGKLFKNQNLQKHWSHFNTEIRKICRHWPKL